MHGDGRSPELVDHYLDRALSPGSAAAQQVRITQTGEMFKSPGARAMRFTATERFAVDGVAFSWEARFPVAPLVSLKVRDGYAEGAGMFSVRALGFPLQTRSGPALAVGEAFRYLAELPWVPQAMAANRDLKWQQVGDLTVEVTTAAGHHQPTVRIEFDRSGDIIRCWAEARPRDVNGSSVPTRWGGDLGRYQTLGGMRMPTRGEVYWDLPEGRFVYWRGEVTSASALEEPFERS